MDLSPEMSSYIKTGRCPHCNAVLLTEQYIAQMGDRLERAAIGRAHYFSGEDPVLVVVDIVTRKSPGAYEKTLVGPERKARVIGSAEMQCLICTKKWGILPPPPPPQSMKFGPLLRVGPVLRVGPAQAGPAAASNTPPSNLARSIDLSGCRVTGLLEKKQIEMPWGAEDRKTYSNTTTRSSMTKEVTISKELTRTVTVESDKLKAHNAGANINIVGFAAIQGQVQDQIGERYSVATQATFTRSGTTRFEIPPGASVQHVIHWVATCKTGLAILGLSSDPRHSRLAEVPYLLPWDLDYYDEIQ